MACILVVAMKASWYFMVPFLLILAVQFVISAGGAVIVYKDWQRSRARVQG
jgi:hypothetical protein